MKVYTLQELHEKNLMQLIQTGSPYIIKLYHDDIVQAAQDKHVSELGVTDFKFRDSMYHEKATEVFYYNSENWVLIKHRWLT